MVWLKDLAHTSKKTIVLVTHAVSNLRLCDSVVLLHDGRLVFQGAYDDLLTHHQTDSIKAIYGGYQHASAMGEFVGFDEDRSGELPPAPEPHSLNTAPPPGSLSQLFTLVRRQNILIWRDKAQIWLHLVLLLSFPGLVAIFATNGLPQVRSMSLEIQTNVVQSLADALAYMKESFSAAALVSGLSMFQVILLALMGANNGAREIAKERDVLEKELRAGLSPWAYVTTKVLLVVFISLAQAFWMTWFVKTVCGFKGDFISQFEILFATTLAMSVTCLAISSAAKSPERASLLAIYLVGLQLPLSGARTRAARSREHALPPVHRGLLGLEWLFTNAEIISRFRYRRAIHAHHYCRISHLLDRTFTARRGLRRRRVDFCRAEFKQKVAALVKA